MKRGRPALDFWMTNDIGRQLVISQLIRRRLMSDVARMLGEIDDSDSAPNVVDQNSDSQETDEQVAVLDKQLYRRVSRSIQRENKRLGINMYQRCIIQTVSEIGLWDFQSDSSSSSKTNGSTPLGVELESLWGGLAPSYVVSRPPNMNLLYINGAAQDLFGYSSSRPERESLFSFITKPPFCDAIKNAQEYYTHTVRFGFGMLKLASNFGINEGMRAGAALLPLLAYYRQMYGENWLVDGYESSFSGASVLDLLSTKQQLVKHGYGHQEKVLKFNVMWMYLSDRQSFQAIYEPMDEDASQVLRETWRARNRPSQ